MNTTLASQQNISVVLVLAASENGIIGIADALPWKLSDDLNHFKRTTNGRPVIMGRKTFDSVGAPLPDRHNIVITRDKSWSREGVLVHHNFDEALASAIQLALCDGSDSVMVVGGAEIYQLALPEADKVILTRVFGSVEGDVTFDLSLLSGWREVQLASFSKSERNSHDFAIVELIPSAC